MAKLDFQSKKGNMSGRGNTCVMYFGITFLVQLMAILDIQAKNGNKGSSGGGRWVIYLQTNIKLPRFQSSFYFCGLES